MTRSTIEPQAVKLWRVKDGRVDVTATWDARQITVEDKMNGDRQEWEYDELRFSYQYDGPPERAQAYVTAIQDQLIAVAKARCGIESATDRDKEIGAAIGAKLNPSAPIDEQLAILRKQVAELIALTKATPTAEFDRLTEISSAEEVKRESI